jgi:dTDP-4-dehydrorhamnose reductase
MTILLFGAAGQVGAETRRLAGSDAIIAAARVDADLATPGAAAALIDRVRPRAIINAAAYTAVDKAESERDLAFRINAEAAGEIAAAAAQAGARLVHLSTDYVFDGRADTPIDETAPTAPLSVYGESKRAGEIAVLARHEGAVIVRTSWVFAPHGANFVRTMLRLGKTRDAISVVDDQQGGPTPADAIAALCLKIASGPGPAGIYHFQGAPAATWADFAEAIFSEAGYATRVKRIPTRDYPTPAQRPLYTVLNCSRIARDYGAAQPDWRSALPAAIAALKGLA